ncbi:MAG: FAD-dependent oxidoreductase [Kiritimatiellae bacterium]|nr:FAD-dependent oxidoreductase [Kiritimatiellia bacterium]
MDHVHSKESFRVAVLGAGPAGLYAAAELLKRDDTIHVDIFDKMDVPFGLIRFGVAPDHPHTRAVCKVFDTMLKDPRVRFLGGVAIGATLSVEQLSGFYNAVVVATGAESANQLDIDGSKLPGVCSALDFVGWVNGRPGLLEQPVPLTATTAVIIGNGNVALDVVRLLLKPPADFAGTDINSNALSALQLSNIRHVHVLGRRGPAQASFRLQELEEVLELPDCDIHVSRDDLILCDASLAELSGDGAAVRARRQIVDAFRGAVNRSSSGAEKQLTFRFCESPVCFEGNNTVERMTLSKNTLRGSAGDQTVVASDNVRSLTCGLVISSIGQRGVPLQGIPFDATYGIIPSVDGRIQGRNGTLVGLYASGWISRGATGLIGHNKPDAKKVVDAISEDRASLKRRDERDVLTYLTDMGIQPVPYCQ